MDNDEQIVLNEQELIEDIYKVYDGELISISKDDEEGPGTAKWSFAAEGEIDKHGDYFAAGAIDMERAKGTVASFNHNDVPAGVWTMSREGNILYANVDFLDTQAGQDCRKYVKAMGPDAQFSFKAKVIEREFSRDIPGILYKSVRAYETSPVFIGAGNNTRLVTVKSLENKESDMDENEKVTTEVEVQKEQSSAEVPAWAESLQKEMAELKESMKPPVDKVDEVRKAVDELSDVEKQELGIPVFDSGRAEVKKYAEPVRPNHLGFIEKEGDLIFDMTKEFMAQPDFKDLTKSGSELASYTSQASGLDVMKADLVDIGRVYSRDRIRMEVTPTEYVLDMLPMLPVAGNSVQVPVMEQASGVPDMNEPNVANEITINVPVYTYPVQNLTFSHPVNRSALEDDPSLMAGNHASYQGRSAEALGADYEWSSYH